MFETERPEHIDYSLKKINMSKPKSIYPEQKFHCLTVIAFHHTAKTHYRIWECLCECGSTTYVSSGALNSGNTRSCGCLQRQTARQTRLSHGMSRKKCPEYDAWVTMRYRCNDPIGKLAVNYSGRGIKVCTTLGTFETFYPFVGPRPSPKHSIDRVNNDGSYTCGECSECTTHGWPMNVRWATKQQQQQNTRQNVWITFQGITLCKIEWARKTGISYNTLDWRLAHWTVERALTTPPQLSSRK